MKVTVRGLRGCLGEGPGGRPREGAREGPGCRRLALSCFPTDGQVQR